MKKYIEDPHYHFDDVTRKITFHKEHELYDIEKTVFANREIDIDKIITIDEYDHFRMEYRFDFLGVFEAKWREVKPKSLEEKFHQCIMLNDFTEAKRLRDLINRKRALHLYVVK